MSRYVTGLCAALLVLVFSLAMPDAALAQGGPAAAPTTSVDVHPLPPTANAAVAFDAEKATNAYLARVSG